MGNKPGGRNKTQQPIQSLLEDAISALREKPGSKPSDIIKYLESKYEKSISTKMKEKLLDRLKPILKASRMEFNNNGSLRGPRQQGGGKGGFDKARGGGSGRVSRGTRSGANSMKRRLGGTGIGKQGGQGAGSSQGSARRQNNNGRSNRVINSSHGGGRSSAKLALSRCKTKSKRTRGRGRPSAHVSKLDSSISPHIDINGDHYDNNYQTTGCRSDLDSTM
ncbi:hypothetical protein BDL97_04G004500 [Sphagnum fallax]|jgi:hypothetical protein|nr:hypothetical protein BDL97_04G004500 [Sphagnum fallax]